MSERIVPVILAGGFGRRTEGILGDLPKTLLPTKDGETLLDHLVNDLSGTGFKSAVLVSNDKFFDVIKKHLREKKFELKVRVLNDGAENKETRLGAIGDMLLVVEKENFDRQDKSLLIVASDYAYWKSFKIGDFLEFAKEKKDHFVTIARDVKDTEIIKGRFGCLEINGKSEMVSFEEKPENPKSSLAAVAFYLYRPKHLKYLREYKEGGGNIDSPGYIIPYLLKKDVKIAVFVVEDNIIDVGNPEDIEKGKIY